MYTVGSHIESTFPKSRNPYNTIPLAAFCSVLLISGYFSGVLDIFQMVADK